MRLVGDTLFFFAQDCRWGLELWALDVEGLPVPPEILRPPTGLGVADLTDSSVTLSWRDNAGNESGYELERRGPRDDAFDIVAVLSAGSQDYTDTPASSGTYWYRVRATSPGGPSAFSGPVRASVLGSGGLRKPGDTNGDGRFDISDAVATLGVLFLGNPTSFPCGDGGPRDPANISLIDWQPDGMVDISDAVAILNFLFLGGPPHTLAPGADPNGCVRIDGCSDLCGK